MADVYSKYVRKRWTLDASASGSLSYDDRNRDHREEIYRDIMFQGRHYDELRRITHTDDAYTRYNNEWASLRVAYSSDSLYLQHMAGFSRNAVPGSMTRSTLSLSSPGTADNPTTVSRSEPVWNGKESARSRHMNILSFPAMTEWCAGQSIQATLTVIQHPSTRA